MKINKFRQKMKNQMELSRADYDNHMNCFA